LISVGAPTLLSDTVAFWYAGLTIATVAVGFMLRGIPRAAGILIIIGYAVFVTRI